MYIIIFFDEYTVVGAYAAPNRYHVSKQYSNLTEMSKIDCMVYRKLLNASIP